jgi:hypothetical protein
MKKSIEVIFLLALFLLPSPRRAASDEPVFQVEDPDYLTSPLTGMTRRHWLDAAQYVLSGAFSYIHTLDDPMKFPKQFDKTYPNDEGQVPTEKLEGLCRTLFYAAPLLKENPDLTLNGIRVGDYYRHQIVQLFNPESPSYIAPRGNGGASQKLVEFGALAISLTMIPELLWDPLTDEQKAKMSSTMISYGDGPTVGSNWRFFNIFVLSFFKDQGYAINEERLLKYLDESLTAYRGYGWYNDSPAYDYYSMWAFQMYGPLWAQKYGKKHYPERAERFMNNLTDLVGNYPYMFSRDGRMNMWGRSIPYRYAAVIPLALTDYLDDPSINYGWMRRIASSTLLQFLEHPGFMEDRVPTLGFYGPFDPAVQIYSCRGSIYWSGKVFFALFQPEGSLFWTAIENNGPWSDELKPGAVYNKFQPGSNLLITDYPNSGAAEMRSWCHEKVSSDWQKFRSTENYNKLAYNTEFPWMADGPNGEISMNYGVLNAQNQWEVLRLYTFKSFENGIYRRDAVLETDENIRFQLADIPLPDGILRVDRVTVPRPTEVRLGHYALPQRDRPITSRSLRTRGRDVYTIDNGRHQLAMIPLHGWEKTTYVSANGLHPESEICMTLNTHDRVESERIYVTLQLWKAGDLSSRELSPVKEVTMRESEALVEVEITFADHSRKVIPFGKSLVSNKKS